MAKNKPDVVEEPKDAAPVVEKKPKAEKADESIWVSMVKDGITIEGVHPDAVPAHEAIGYKLVPVEKSIKPADHTATLDEGAKTANNG